MAHYACTIVLFAMFAVYAILLFPLTPTGVGNKVSLRYGGLNAVYLICGALIVVSMIWAGFFADGSILVPESIAMAAFAVSWLVKGKALRDTARSVVRGVKSVMRHEEKRAAQTTVQKG